MQLLVFSRIHAVLALAAILFCLSPQCFADSIGLTSSALSSTVLAPSSDSISLNAGSISLTSNSGPAIFQTGELYLGNSPIADQIIPFSFNDTITLNGITQVLDIFGQDNVTSTVDTLTIFAGAPILFGQEFFTLQSFDTAGTIIGEDLPIELQASVSSTPEPNTLLLLGTGVFAIIVLAAMARGSSVSSANLPPSNFIKMPTPTRSWVQRGSTFHAAASGSGQPPHGMAPSSQAKDVDKEG